MYSMMLKLRHVGFHSPVDRLSAQGTVFQGWSALYTANQMSAWQKHHSDFFVHAYFTGSLLLQHSVFGF